MCGRAGKGEGPSSRGFFENLLHGVAFCCIFLVIVKFAASPGAPGTGQVGEARGHEGLAGGYFLGNDRMCGRAGKGEGPSSRGFFENLLHGVAFCCIFLVIVKFSASLRAPGTGQVGEAAWFSFVVFAPYRAILRHFLVVVRVGGLRPLMDSVARMFLSVKLGKSVVSVQSSWGEHPPPLWIPAFAGMTVAVCVERSQEV